MDESMKDLKSTDMMRRVADRRENPSKVDPDELRNKRFVGGRLTPESVEQIAAHVAGELYEHGVENYVRNDAAATSEVDKILADDPETAQEILDWQEATYLLIGTLLVQQGKMAATITPVELEKFRSKFKLEFTTGKGGSLNYRVRPLPKKPGANHV